MGVAYKHESSELSIEELSEHISSIIGHETGNILGPKQQAMVVSRLKKRMLDIGIHSNGLYLNHFNHNKKEETTFLVSLLTTHHTFFFREFIHFEYLQKNFLSIVENVKKRGDTKIRIWSAACSRGQEVYSLAMMMDYLIKANKTPIDFEIFGTDIDPESVSFSKNGVYPYKEIIEVPRTYLADHWQKGTGEISQYVKVKKSLRDHCQFDVLNLLKPEKIGLDKKYDFIFCRNVFIYFDNKTIFSICEFFKQHLFPTGALITGLSESLNNSQVKVKQIESNIYSFNFESVNTPKLSIVEPIQKTATITPSKKLRLLCVDDSQSILKLMEKMFFNDPEFELIGTAKNGIEAKEFLKSNKVDVMTLDIHMPEMDGVTYLKENYNKSHPKVLVVSSASREDTTYAQKTIEYGASDFVEKPNLNNLMDKADEIKVKLKTMLMDNASKFSSVDRSFKNDFTIQKPEEKAIFLFSQFSDIAKLSAVLKDYRGGVPPIFLFFEGNANFSEIIKTKLVEFRHNNVVVYDATTTSSFNPNYIYVCEPQKDFDLIKIKVGNHTKSIGVIGGCSKKIAQKILSLNNVQILLEDSVNVNSELKSVASDLFPVTSFAHVATEYLAKEKK